MTIKIEAAQRIKAVKADPFAKWTNDLEKLAMKLAKAAGWKPLEVNIPQTDMLMFIVPKSVKITKAQLNSVKDALKKSGLVKHPGDFDLDPDSDDMIDDENTKIYTLVMMNAKE